MLRKKYLLELTSLVCRNLGKSLMPRLFVLTFLPFDQYHAMGLNLDDTIFSFTFFSNIAIKFWQIGCECWSPETVYREKKKEDDVANI